MSADGGIPQGRYEGYQKNRLQFLEPDDELQKIGPGTPCGDYLRRFWMPITMTSQLPEDRPLRLRRMGEDLVLFKDKSGRYGLLHLNCSHRNTSLEFGIIEDRGLRCCYHGWKYDVDGTILETPGEPETSKIKEKVCHGAYPVLEYKGLVFAYFGPSAERPPFPFMDVMELEGDTMVPFMIPSPCNWMQVSENSFDPYHTVFLHTRVTGPQFVSNFGVMPVIDIFERQYGYFYTNSRRCKDKIWLRIHDHLHPNFSQNGSMFPTGEEQKYFLRAGLTRWVVPVDDTNTMTIAWRHFIDGYDPLGLGDPNECGYNKVDFYGQTDQRPYEQRQRNPGDYEAWVGQGPRNVHKRENLAFTDRGVAMVRRQIREDIRKVAAGKKIDTLASLGNPLPTYGGDTVLRIPPRNADDRQLVSEISHKVAAIYRSGDAYQGRDREEFIIRELKKLETSYGG